MVSECSHVGRGGLETVYKDKQMQLQTLRVHQIRMSIFFSSALLSGCHCARNFAVVVLRILVKDRLGPEV